MAEEDFSVQAREDLGTLLNLSRRLIEMQAGLPIEEQDVCLADAQVLAIKMVQHFFSMREACREVVLQDGGKAVGQYIDHASAKILARAGFETFLVFSHVFRCPPQVGLFRHMTWHLAGLSDRKGFLASTAKDKRKLQAEKEMIEDLKQSISNHPQFRCFNPCQQKKLLAGDWRAGIERGWKGLAEKAGFNRSYIDQAYSYFCSYAHSSYLSVLQLRQATSLEHQRMLSGMSFDVANSVLGHFAFAYSEVFPAARHELERDSRSKRCAEAWCFRSSPSR